MYVISVRQKFLLKINKSQTYSEEVDNPVNLSVLKKTSDLILLTFTCQPTTHMALIITSRTHYFFYLTFIMKHGLEKGIDILLTTRLTASVGQI